jgi:very-short-patch-repair endonuclease
MSPRSTAQIERLPDPAQDPEVSLAPPKGKARFEVMFAQQLLAFRRLKVERQLRFAKSIGRQWKFDFAFPKYKLAVEIDGVVVRRIGGVVVTMGYHADVTGLRKSNEKGAAAIMLGWSVLHFLQDDVRPRRAIDTTLRVLAQRGWRA